MGGKSREIKLSTRTFSKAGDGTEFFRSMLGRYKNGQRVSDADAADLHALLERHDDRDDKIGQGISHFYTDTAPEGFTRCFWVARTDGSHEDFSFMHCLKKKPYD